MSGLACMSGTWELETPCELTLNTINGVVKLIIIRLNFKETFVTWGASTVKWTTLDPCSCLSESDPKLYTNFEFHEIEIHRHLENIRIYKAKRFMFTKNHAKNNFKQRICILQDGASGEQVGDIEKKIVQNLFEI
jgi:hypothetical protein